MILSVKHTVADFESWKRGFDEHVGVRKEHGAIGHRLARDLDDPSVVLALVMFPERTDAEGFVADPSLREAMKNAGVTSEPEITFIDVTEEVPY